jgi:signal transduction histidine kinase
VRDYPAQPYGRECRNKDAVRLARQLVLHVCLTGALSAGVGTVLALWSGASAAQLDRMERTRRTAVLVAAAIEAPRAREALAGNATAAQELRAQAERIVGSGEGVTAISIAPLADPTVAPMLGLASAAPSQGPSRSLPALMEQALRAGGLAVEPLAGDGARAYRAVVVVRDARDVAAALAILDLAAPAAVATPLGLWPLILAMTLAGAFAALARRRFAAPIAAITESIDATRTAAPVGSFQHLATAVADLAAQSKRLEHELDDRVRVRTRELEAHCRLKDEMAANTVHELRTPLTTILASLGIVVDNIAETEDERRMFLGNALVAARHLMFLCNDILDTAAFEAGKLRMEIGECDIGSVLEETASLMGPIALSRSINLRVEPCAEPLLARGDRNRVLQVIFNLVSNAVKYSRTDGSVLVRAQRAGNSVAIEVEDDGIGVPVASRGKLFTKFSRVHAESSSVSGTGIGLYLCRVLVEHMEGSIGFDERGDGPGSVFWFTLPVWRAAKRESALAAPAR